jgi:hypothetical protein
MISSFVADGASRLQRAREAESGAKTEPPPPRTWAEWFRSFFTFNYELY